MKITLTINNVKCVGKSGQTILQTATANGIEIPTLCHDERVEIYGSCGICVVEVEGNPKLLRACSAIATDGMIVNTETERVRRNRKTTLELLLSDHTGDCRPPCTLACPAQTDCQGYVGLIANGRYTEANELIMDKIPLPASIGRVCPHPCEDACRRELVEEPIAIAALKQFAGDLALKSMDSGQNSQKNNNPQPASLTAPLLNEPLKHISPTDKSVAIIGGGPGGLTAAYFLARKGNSVTIYDAMPQMGGMLRYGIPEYRLPKEVLQPEIDNIERLGVKFVNNTKIGQDIMFDELRNNFDAVIVAVGAWSSIGLNCAGEDLDGVLGGIDFLRDVALGNAPQIGNKVAIIGGGNTAMDACRTAVRLGSKEVYNIYRRTKNEMPAEKIELIEAEEEGVIFQYLKNPIEIIGENGRVKSIRLQIMELGEPDATGRRSSVPINGKEEILKVDTLIVAIGQKFNSFGLESLEQTNRQTLSADEHTFTTNLDGVFAIGDATNKGTDIAISAIGEAKKAVEMVEKYLNGEKLIYSSPYLHNDEKTAEDFADKPKEQRVKMPHRCGNERRNDFREVNFGFSKDEAKREANRCLECGCLDFFECKLLKYANLYHVKPEKYDGKVNHAPRREGLPNIDVTPDKCILCGLCVRLCGEEIGEEILGFVGRGFDTSVKPAGDLEACKNCGKCADICPTGALVRKTNGKPVPLKNN